MKQRLITKTILLCALFLLSITQLRSQTVSATPFTPGGHFDKIYDKDGRSYDLKDYQVRIDDPNAARQVSSTTSCTAGYFNVYFALGCGMETNSASDIQERAVICEVLKSISSMVNNTLSATSTKVNILVETFSVVALPGALGVASGFLTFPANPASANPGIATNMIYKTITSGQNAYIGITPPVIASGTGNGFYHGLMAFDPNATWNTTMTIAPPAGTYDLFTVALHEITHALGFASLIDYNGVSRLGAANNYFSTYDKFLYSPAGVPLLSVGTPSCQNYNLTFSGSNTLVAPNGTYCPGSSNITSCAGAIRYISPNIPSGQNMKCYTPTCYEKGSSLSHFEDMCYPTNNPANNDLYFVMSNANGTAVFKRYLKDEERKVLCDIGYNCSTTYTSNAILSTSLNTTHTYTGSICTNPFIWGVNDGIVGSNYVYTSLSNTIAIPIPATSSLGILFNDSPTTTTFTCLEDVYNNGSAVVSGTNIIYTANPSFTGAFVLRYVPVDASNNKGNITYIIGYIINSNCNPVSPCNLVQNGEFENFSFPNISNPVCGVMFGNSSSPFPSCWENFAINGTTPDILTAGCTNLTTFNVGVNTQGTIPPANAYSSTNNNSFAGFGYTHNAGFAEAMKNYLGTPLVPGQSYKLSFWLMNNSKPVPDQMNSVQLPWVLDFCSSEALSPALTAVYPSTLNVVQEFTISGGFNQWVYYTTTFTFSPANNLNHPTFMLGVNDPKTNLQGFMGAMSCYAFIDGISLQPIGIAPTFTLPSPLCAGQSIINLQQYAQPPGGVFSGSGVTLTSGQYDFNLSGALTPSLYTVTYVTTNTTTGCTYNTFAQTTILSNTLSLTLAASPPTVCLLNVSSANSTLTAGGANTYTWLPGSFTVNPLTVAVSSTNNPVFTVMGTNSLGCIATKTIQLGLTETEASLLNIPPICNTGTINLNTYSSPSSTNNIPVGTYSLNGVSTNSIVGPLTAGVYTVNYTYTASIICTYTAQTTFTVLPNIVTPTIAATATLICPAVTSITLTASPTGQAYYWVNNASTSYSIIVSPSVSTVYTVQAGSTFGNCIQTATFAIQTTTLPCGCYGNCNTNLSTNLSSSPASGTVYCVPGNVSINGVVTFSNSDFRINPNVNITVYPNGILNIVGSHLYSCDNMWQGIIVKQGGKVNVSTSSTSRTSLIEDAFIAIDLEATAPTYTANNILIVDNATFNRNQTAIRIGDYVTSQNPYPFSITNSLFTSRTIAFTPLTHPSTSTVKNSLSGNTSSLQTPYVSNSSYPALGLKAPLAGTMPDNGVILNEVGHTISTSTTTTFYGITIGNSTVAANFNCFDNLRQDITATNSNLLLANNYFQEGQRYGRGLAFGGKSIVANSNAVSLDVKGARNNQIQIVSVSTSTALNNRFYEKVSCADINGYINIEVKNAQAYSYANNYSGFTLINAIGDRGFNVVTNRYFNIIFDNNRIYNIKNAMLTGIDNASQWFASGTGNFGRMVGKINVQNNIVNRHPGTAVSGEYVNIGFSLSDPFSSATTNIALTGSSNFIQGNNFGNVHNGISVANVAFSSVSIYSNNITLVNEPSSLGAPIQNGIYTTQLGTSVIQQNNIAGPTTFTNDISAIKTSMNNLLTVKCNTTANTYHGLNFNASQAVTTVQDNIMQNQKYGISMTNTATIGTQGTSTSPTNNQWLGSWAGNFKTMNYNLYSSASNSKIYATWGGTLDPNGSGTVIATPGAMFTDNYFHYPSVNAANTILNSSSINPTCRAGGEGGSEGGSGFAAMNSQSTSSSTITLNQRSLMENLVNNTTPNIANEIKYIDKNRVYRTLAANSSYTNGSTALSTFYTNAQSSCMNKFLVVEKDLASGNITSAQNNLATITSTNNIESNYYTFYNLYIKLKNATFSNADSTVLLNLCTQCPFTDGGIVYQARALYNIMNSTYAKFNDNCNLSVGSRLFDDVVKNEPEINVLIKTKLYPNPNNGEFTVESDNKSDDSIEEIAIYDLTGKLISTISDRGDLIKVNTKLLKGSYLVKVRLTNNSVDVHRIIID